MVEGELVSEHRLGEPDNPEGHPRCPKCGEFVEVDEDDIDYYYCGECEFRFPLGEAK